MSSDSNNKPALNTAMREAVDFVHAEGWDQPATLFALVPTSLLPDAYISTDEKQPPLSLIVQEDLPSHIRPGSEELGEFIATLRWPDAVLGIILAQEIMFRNSALGEDSPLQAARLYSGVLRSGAEQTFVQLRPTEEELEADPFAQDKIELLGGEDIGSGVLAVLRASLEEDIEQL